MKTIANLFLCFPFFSLFTVSFEVLGVGVNDSHISSKFSVTVDHA